MILSTIKYELFLTTTDPWGIKITRVELKNILPPADIQNAMEKQMRAERERRGNSQSRGEKTASILVSEGKKQSAILEAEADKASAILRAEAERKPLSVFRGSS